MAELATVEGGHEVARPLKVLSDLIKSDLKDAEQAGAAHYESAAAKLIEAREGHFRANAAFYNWAQKEFGKSQATIRTWIAWGARTGDFKNLEEFTHAPKKAGGLGVKRHHRLRREWVGPVDELAQKALDDARKLALEASLTRKQEADADRKLGLRLIDIGWKVLARELHPDHGGSPAAMTRLNRVRSNLKECMGG